MCKYFKTIQALILTHVFGLGITLAQDTIPELNFTPIVSGISRPVDITHAGDGSKRLFLLEQTGIVRIVEQGQRLDAPFLNISNKVSCCGEQGLLGIAFPPDYKSKKYFYVNYTDKDGDTVLSRFITSNDPNRATANSEEILLTIPQPFANHNGGHIAFGPDKFLYVAMGDGGSANDPQNNGQRRDTLLGKILRIDVESNTKPYGIPPDNPFLNTPTVKKEIWASGLRNPWRFSFDRATGDLYIADVGQELFEEVNVQPASSKGGENYGWNIMEGAHCFKSSNCDQRNMVLPKAEYDHKQGCSVTGGYVYRGTKYPDLTGIYFYADFCSGQMWGLRKAGEKWDNFSLPQTPYSISTFGEDEAGELYMADYSGGIIYQLASTTVLPPPSTNPPQPPSPTNPPGPTEPTAPEVPPTPTVPPTDPVIPPSSNPPGPSPSSPDGVGTTEPGGPTTPPTTEPVTPTEPTTTKPDPNNNPSPPAENPPPPAAEEQSDDGGSVDLFAIAVLIGFASICSLNRAKRKS